MKQQDIVAEKDLQETKVLVGDSDGTSNEVAISEVAKKVKESTAMAVFIDGDLNGESGSGTPTIADVNITLTANTNLKQLGLSHLKGSVTVARGNFGIVP